jgi:hypothetical protein
MMTGHWSLSLRNKGFSAKPVLQKSINGFSFREKYLRVF